MKDGWQKTSEDLLQYAVDALCRRRNLGITGWSVLEDHSISPGRYVVFLETDPVIRPEDRGTCRDILEEELASASDFYRQYIGDGHLSPMKLVCLQPQTCQLYRELMIYKGASSNQMKPVHMIDNSFVTIQNPSYEALEYEDQKRKLLALEGVSFCVEEGEFL